MNDHRYEFLIAGSGAGGATLAHELSAAGKEVLILERGRWEEKFGTFNDAVRFYDGNKLTRVPKKSLEGNILYHTFMAGGTTNVSCGNGMRSLEGQLRERGIELSKEFIELETALNIHPVPEHMISEGSQRMRQSANDLGFKMHNMPKFVDFERCTSCGLCNLGCVAGAKWTALQPLQKALEHGAQVQYDTKVEKVIIENGKAVGVECISNGEIRTLKAEMVILAAGGLNTPVILKKSGFDNAGDQLFMDLFVDVYGRTGELNQLKEPAMALVLDDCHDDQGFILSPYLNVPRPIRFIECGAAGALLNPRKMIGLMVKTKDDSSGKVYIDGSVSKFPTPDDQVRLNSGQNLAREIIVRAGAKPNSILVSNLQGAHPGGTAAIGRIVDENLQTQVENLFVCDASVLPESPGMPPILTISALAKFLSKKLT